jgi:predicted nucleotidyltransferase
VNRDDIVRYLEMLGAELQQRGVTGEIVIAGGAFMLLIVRNRETTKDVDAYFSAEPQAIRDAARVVAQQEGLPEDWLNDSVNGFFYQVPPVTKWAEYPGLRVFMVSPEYVLALKAIAARPEDVPDLKALIDMLALKTPQDALDIVARYVPQRLVPPKAQYLIETLFDEDV